MPLKLPLSLALFNSRGMPDGGGGKYCQREFYALSPLGCTALNHGSDAA